MELLAHVCKNVVVFFVAFVQVVGRVLLLHLVNYLSSHYPSDPLVSSLLNSSRVHILPSMNPDGFESSKADCIYTVGR